VKVLVQRRRYDPRLLYQTWKVVRLHRISIIQSHGYKSALIAWLLRRLTGLPWIAFAEGYTSENRRMALYNRLDQWLLRRANAVVAVSKATATLLERSGVATERLTVIPNTIDPDDYRIYAHDVGMRAAWGVQADELVIGVVGRFSPEKGQAIFLKAFQKVFQRVPLVKAVLIGEGPDEHRLRSLVASCGVKDRVLFAGYQADVSPVYAALDLVVIPSMSEGLPLVLLEALLHGKAVVATSVGGIPDILQGPLSEWLVPPNDVDALVDTIVAALEDPQKRALLQMLGSRHVREVCSSKERAEKVFALYRSVMDGTRPCQQTLRSTPARDPKCL
jgi:glycosyltransferase involved in cell wall biosynthesis